MSVWRSWLILVTLVAMILSYGFGWTWFNNSSLTKIADLAVYHRSPGQSDSRTTPSTQEMGGNLAKKLADDPLEIVSRFDRFIAAKNDLAATIEAQKLEAALKAGLLDLGGIHSDVIRILIWLDLEYGAEGKQAQADELRQLILPVPWEQTIDVMMATNERYQELMKRGEYGRALVEAQKLEALQRVTSGTENKGYASVIARFADAHAAQSRYDLAEDRYKRALAIIEKIDRHADVDEFVLRTLDQLAELYSRQDRYADAEPLLQADAGDLRKSPRARTTPTSQYR